MKYKLKLVTKLILVIGQKIGSQNPLKYITSTMVASCFDITLPNYLQYKVLQKYKNHVVRFPVTLYSSPLSIKTQIPILITLITFLLTFVLFCFVMFFPCFYSSLFIFPFPIFHSIFIPANKLKYLST